MFHKKKKISIVAPTFNEQDNVDELYERVQAQIKLWGNKYDHEIIIIDNCSTDQTHHKLRKIAQNDKHFKVIINSRNFGHIRSPFYVMTQATGDAIVYLASDLQDPPEKITEFVEEWEKGYKIVLGIKENSEEAPIFFMVRKLFYTLIKKIADDETELVKNCTGFGLYDKQIIEIAKSLDDPYPYFRGLLSEIGFEKSLIPFTQPLRKRGFTKNNFYTLYDNAMIGIVKHSKFPLRLMAFSGFLLSFLSFSMAIGYLIAKLLFWEKFSVGIAPMVISVCFFSSVQLFAMGILGEYIGAIYTRVNKKPLVVERERLNF